MKVHSPIEALEIHRPIWERFQLLLENRRFPQALLLVGPRHARVTQLIHRLVAVLLCQTGQACGACEDCYFHLEGLHPDAEWIRQEAVGRSIKIEQIRALQQTVFQTPKRARYRVVVIESAHQMNVSASNALLKILEEPPEHTIFILAAEQISSVLPTILSRCQKYTLPDSDLFCLLDAPDPALLASYCSDDPERLQLFEQSQSIISALCNVIQGRVSPCSAASDWSAYSFYDLIWFLYLLTAKLIRDQLLKRPSEKNASAASPLNRLAGLSSPARLFHQLDSLSAILNKINHNVNMNQTLALETLLLGYLSGDFDG